MHALIKAVGATTFRTLPIPGQAPPSSTDTSLLLGTLRKHPIRVFTRLTWLSSVFVVTALDYLISVTCRRDAGTRPEGLQTARTRWLQRGCRRALRVLHLDVEVTGDLPSHGLVVCNHLGYLDVLALASVLPATFVAKCEVRAWPLVGWFARM